MFYTYVLRCRDGKLYVGSALDLRKRIAQHRAGRVRATAHRLPVKLEYYEACRSELKARLREEQLKTGFGRAYLKRRLEGESQTPPATLRVAMRARLRRAAFFLFAREGNNLQKYHPYGPGAASSRSC